MSELIKSEEIYWCKADDRYVRVFRHRGEIVGLNYMQGKDMQGKDFAAFEESYNDIDEDLTNFYLSVQRYLNGETEIDRINQAIWAHFDYNNNY